MKKKLLQTTGLLLLFFTIALTSCNSNSDARIKQLEDSLKLFTSDSGVIKSAAAKAATAKTTATDNDLAKACVTNFVEHRAATISRCLRKHETGSVVYDIEELSSWIEAVKNTPSNPTTTRKVSVNFALYTDAFIEKYANSNPKFNGKSNNLTTILFAVDANNKLAKKLPGEGVRTDDTSLDFFDLGESKPDPTIDEP